MSDTRLPLRMDNFDRTVWAAWGACFGVTVTAIAGWLIAACILGVYYGLGLLAFALLTGRITLHRKLPGAAK